MVKIDKQYQLNARTQLHIKIVMIKVNIYIGDQLL